VESAIRGVFFGKERVLAAKGKLFLIRPYPGNLDIAKGGVGPHISYIKDGRDTSKGRELCNKRHRRRSLKAFNGGL